MLHNRGMARIRYTKELLETIVKESWSVADVLRALGLKYSGGSYNGIQRRIRHYGIDISHFLGKTRNRGEHHRGGPERQTAEEVLVVRDARRPPEKTYKLRRALMEAGRSYRCEACGQGPCWNGRPLILHVDHINGVRHDCRADNLRFLCPNCHTQTANYGVRNR